MFEPYVLISTEVAKGGKYLKEWNFLGVRIVKWTPIRHNKDSFASYFFYPNNMGKTMRAKLPGFGFNKHNYTINVRRNNDYTHNDRENYPDLHEKAL